MINQEQSVKIVLDSIITKLEQYGFNYSLDAEVIALFTVFKGKYDLNSYAKRYNKISTDNYLNQWQANIREWELCVEYAITAIYNTEKERRK